MHAMTTSSEDPTGSETRRPLVPSSVLGMIIFVLTEMMFFGALISAFLIIKSGNIMWPPQDQPRLPISLTAVNTMFLVASGVCVYFSNKAFAARSDSWAKKQLGIAIALALVFVGIQSYEWVRMLGHGLTMRSSTYGSFFYMIIGCHALHVFAALTFLIRIYLKFETVALKPSSYWGVQVFWYFVVGVWPVLYYLVYLS